jgi:hypothetical protein
MMILQDRNMSECFKGVLCEIICAFVGGQIEVFLEDIMKSVERKVCSNHAGFVT